MIDALLATADDLASGAKPPRLEDSVIALAFFEPSLRTRIGFAVAALRLGAATVTVEEPRHTPAMSAPESLQDTIRVLQDYCDAVCVRHPDVTVLRNGNLGVDTPLINCGSGLGEHPTQALIDLFSVQRIRGAIDGLRIGIIGDLKNMRVAHSLLVTLANFLEVSVRCISPSSLAMPRDLVAHFRENSTGTIKEFTALDLNDLDIVYVAGFPPRAGSSNVDSDLRAEFMLTPERVLRLEEDVRVLCPLPRIDEVAPEVDTLAAAAYFQQSALGLPMRMAILQYALS